MKFVKMHGLGNDFIMIDNLGSSYDNFNFVSFAKKYCDRNFGIGADGVLIVSASQNADANMRLINADGSEAEMCGNGIRCVARYLIDNGFAKSPVKIGTLAGIKTIEKKGSNYRVDMGVPKVIATTTININQKPKKFKATLVDIGNPHCVIFVENFDFDWQSAGKEIENNKLFPNRTNVEFVKVNPPRQLEVRVWERGAGATMACGTGACASLAAAAAIKKAGKKADVKLRSGTLKVEILPNSHVYMTGPAEVVFEGFLQKI